MTRRLLLTGGGGETEPIGPLPPDPTLTTERVVTRTGSINQNVGSNSSDQTIEYIGEEFVEDCNSFQLLFHGASQGFVSNPVRLHVSVRLPGATTWTAVTFNGLDYAEFTDTTSDQSDPIEGVFAESSTFDIRIFMPSGYTINIGRTGWYADGDQRFASTFVRKSSSPAGGPYPVMVTGKARPSVLTPAIYGDSIAAQLAWWSIPLAERRMPGANFGRNAQKFTGRWLDADMLEGVTHMVVQFGVNDLGGGGTIAGLWYDAKACYSYIHGIKPGLPIYQTTPTPMVADTAGDGCATLAGQTPNPLALQPRQNWIAWQRDGMPLDPATMDSIAVGATGIRAGQEGHPISGIIDMAAHTEHGGIDNPSGKWRVDQGVLGGDGIHPDGAHPLMQAAVRDWLDTITA